MRHAPKVLGFPAPRLAPLALALATLCPLGTAQGIAADPYEPNDSCATATPLGGGGFFATTAVGPEWDYYSFEVRAGDEFSCYMLSGSPNHLLDHELTLFADDCATVLASTPGSLGISVVSWENTSPGTETVVLRVRSVATHGGLLVSEVSMDISGVVSACNGAVDEDDALEPYWPVPSDGFVIADGLYTDLFLQPFLDSDRFRVVVPDAATLTVDLVFDTGGAAMHCRLRNDDLGSFAIVHGLPTSTGERLIWTNDTGVARECVLVASFANSDPVVGCGLYDLRVSRSSAAVGVPFCFGDGSTSTGGLAVDCPCGNTADLGEGCANSHGHGARLIGSGTTSVAADDLVLSVSQGRVNQPCMLLQGATRIAVPFKDGILCTGSPTERLEVLFLDGAGAASSVESVAGNGNASPGLTRYYQAWYRDPFDHAPCTARSNLTHALEVDWN